jgi:hypothetical protein
MTECTEICRQMCGAEQTCINIERISIWLSRTEQLLGDVAKYSSILLSGSKEDDYCNVGKELCVSYVPHFRVEREHTIERY